MLIDTLTENLVNDATSTRKQKILFVDDEPNFLNGIRRLLRGQRDLWSMEFANSAAEAIECAEKMDFDAIVSDVNMPGRSGLDLLEMLRANERTQTIPVIILTGNAETALKRKALDLGATDLLNKPVGHEDLVARLRSVLRLKSYQDELRDQNIVLEQRVKERTADLEHARRDIIWRLAKAGELRDEETGNHVLRVAMCCRELATALGLPKDEIRHIFLASPLHDIGKIGIPDSILLKEGPLTPEEREMMERHCEIGSSILLSEPKGIEAFVDYQEASTAESTSGESDALREMAATITMTHHEWWDGGGYPRGLKGADIPIPGRICAVADVYDALRSGRPYKRAFTMDETMDLMRADRETHFCPEVFDTFEGLVAEFEVVRKRFEG